ncbi:hypothetical protein ECC19_01520 [Helicobacter pylori]|nr:hypothetical protein ECC19_01520 [Helicobacter pylori]RVY89048.1 hypothetical protein ECE47_00070 [Helicobacter pylori]
MTPQKKGFKKKGSKKKGFKRNPLKREFHKEPNISKQTHNSNTRYKACGIGVERLAKNSNSC